MSLEESRPLKWYPSSARGPFGAGYGRRGGDGSRRLDDIVGDEDGAWAEETLRPKISLALALALLFSAFFFLELTIESGSAC
jgi:hypothetical protein